MNSTYKLASVPALLMAGAMLLSSAANAQVAECPTRQSLEDFLSTPCRSQDKLFTANGELTSIPNEQIIISLDIVADTDVHRLSYSRGAAAFDDGVYSLAYSISIVDNPDTDEDETVLRTFDSVSLGVDVPGQVPGVTVEKEIGGTGFGENVLDTLVSVNGAEAGPYTCGPCGSTLYIVDTVTIDGGLFNSFTNTFTQNRTPVPAPATLGIFGLGLAAIGMVGVRRRKRSA